MLKPIITQEELDAMKGMFDQDNRAAVYIRYFELTGSDMAVHASMASKFSSFIGQTDEILNDIVKYCFTEEYDFPNDDHSRKITQATLNAVQEKYNVTGNGYLTDLELLKTWEEVWISNGTGEFFSW